MFPGVLLELSLMLTPSMRKLFSDGRAPDTVSFAPFPLRPPLPPAAIAVTPGSSVASCIQSRPLRGNSRIVLPSTVRLTVDAIRSTCVSSAVTSTLDVILSSMQLKVDCSFAAYVELISFFNPTENAGNSAVT